MVYVRMHVLFVNATGSVLHNAHGFCIALTGSLEKPFA